MRVPLPRLFAAAGLLGLAAPAAVAPPAPVAAKAGDPLAAARKALDEVTDFAYENRTLVEVVADIRDRAKIAVTLDPALNKAGVDLDQGDITVALKRVKFRDGLKAALAPYGLRFGLTRDGLFVSTEEGVIGRQLRQRVDVDCDGAPFATAAKQLADSTGVNVVLDPRLKDKANAAVTLKLDDVPLETAVRLLAEVADLRAVRMNNVLFVTTPERADKLRPDADGPVPPSAVAGNPVQTEVPGNGGGRDVIPVR